MHFRNLGSWLMVAVALTAWLDQSVAQDSLARQETVSGLIAAGSRWETPFYVRDSGVKGPTVMVIGGVHGNEPAGSRAAEQIRHWPIVKGRLIVVPRVNLAGLAAKSRFMPDVARSDRDLNRDFAVSDEGELTTRGLLATELWGFAGKHSPDWVIDLHEGFEFNVSHQPAEGLKKSVGSTIIYQKDDELDRLVKRALSAANTHVTKPERTFVPLSRGPVAGSFTRATAIKLGAKSMILETTFADQPISLRTRQHRAMVNALLNDIGLIDQDCSQLLTAGSAIDLIQVGMFDGPGTGSGGKATLPRIIDGATNMEIHYLGVADCQPGVLRQFNILVFPGGSGSRQAKALGHERREHVQKFVRTGGGYVGICAGAYLCSSHYSWSLNLIDSSVFTGTREIEGVGKKSMWYRGEKTRVDLELSEAGKRIFADIPTKFKVNYHNGPIIAPKELPEIEDYTPLAWFRSEQVRYEPQRGTMVNTPAIVAGALGSGRIISISPHPESDKALESIIVESIRWVADKSASPKRVPAIRPQDR